MENNYTKVNATSNPNIQLLQKYSNRFGYMKKPRNSVTDFAIKLDNRLNYFFENHAQYEFLINDVVYPIFHILGEHYSKNEDANSYRFSDLKKLLEKLGKDQELIPILIICDGFIHYLLKEEDECYDAYSLEEQKNTTEWFINAVAEDLISSGVNVALYETPSGFEFYPATEAIFDKVLVTDIFNWLNDFPRAKEQYDKTLKMILQQTEPRDVIDNLRLAFELFIKELFNNEKSLENQKSLIGEYLANHDISKQFSNMYTTLFTYYTTYNNNEAKHNNTADEQEIDFLVYLTGNFMRFLIQLKRNEKKV